jgi:hypothetical protein
MPKSSTFKIKSLLVTDLHGFWVVWRDATRTTSFSMDFNLHDR